MKSEKLLIYIEPSKPYYYPGEQISASAYLDVLSNIHTSKMIIIVKGKEIMKATQKTYIKKSYDSDDNDYDSDDQETISQNKDKKRPSRYYEDDDDSKNSNSISKKVDEVNSIFKFKKVILISNNNILSKGKYTFPFEVTLPNNIPGSFLFVSKNTYAEIIYTIKIKLSGNDNYKKTIPIIIRQKEKHFSYNRETEYNKQIGECCCDFGEVSMKLHLVDRYSICGSKIRSEIFVNNKRCGMKGAPITIELYQTIILHPNDKNTRIKITKLVGKYSGKSKISPRSMYNEDATFVMNENEYINDNVKTTKINKYFKNINVISNLNQSMKCDYINCEYEMYAEVQFSGWSSGELGCFISVLVYPPEKGILLKENAEAIREFSNSMVCKKAYINDKDDDDDKEFVKKIGRNFVEKIFDPKEKKRKDEINNKLYMDDNVSEEDYNDIKNKKKSKVNENDYGNNDMKISTKRNDKKDIDSYEDTNSNDNTNINTQRKLNNNNTSIKKNENGLDSVMNEEGSFGNSTKDKQQRNYKNYFDTNSNNIKKDFDKNYLDDELDEEFLK